MHEPVAERPGDPSSRRWWFAVCALFAVRIAFILIGFATLPAPDAGTGLGNDAARFFQIARSEGRPYQDFEVEFPPLSLAAIRALDATTSAALAHRLAWAMLGCDIAVFAMLARVWDRQIALRYLAIGTPLAFFIYLRLDLLSVALAVGAVALARRRHGLASGATLAAAAFAKVWPLALLPLLAIERARRAVVSCLAVGAVSAIAWVAWGGSDAPMQTLTMRHATGWEIESTVGFVLWQLGRASPRFEAGADRVGSIGPWHTVLVIVAVAVICWVWLRAREDPRLGEGPASVATVAILLVTSPVFSHQYLAWLLPWVAISGDERLRNWSLIACLAAVTTVLHSGQPVAGSYWLQVGALAVRDIATLVILAIALRTLSLEGAPLRLERAPQR
jgi:hypothetical protein